MRWSRSSTLRSREPGFPARRFEASIGVCPDSGGREWTSGLSTASGGPRKICLVKHRGRGASFSEQYLLRAVRIGVLTTLLALIALVVFAFLPGHRPLDRVPYLAVVAAGAVGLIVVVRLPWARWFRDGVGSRVLVAWTAFDVA